MVRRIANIILLVLLGLSWAGPGLGADMPTLNLQVSAGYDDGHTTNGTPNYTSSTNVTCNNGTNTIYALFRFLNFNVPKGSTILPSYFSGYVPASQKWPNTKIYGELAADSADLNTGGSPESRDKTTAYVSWVTTLAGDAVFDSPDIATVLQEYIDDPGYVPGNPFSLIFVANSHAWNSLYIKPYESGVPAGLEVNYTPPEINLKQGATDIADGGTYGFGSKNTGTDTDVVFTIENTAAGTSLTVDTTLELAGDNADQFSIQAQPSSPVAGSSSTTFTVRFSPTTAGAKAAHIDITNGDPDENPYTLNLTGTGVEAGELLTFTQAQPEIKLRARIDYHDGTTTGTLYIKNGSGTCIDDDGHVYEPRLLSGPSISKSVFADGKMGGASTVSYGSIECTNLDDYFSTFKNYYFSNRDVVVEWTYDNWATVHTLWTGTCRALKVNHDTAEFVISGKEWTLDKPLVSVLYASTEVEDVRNKPVPACAGWPKNIPAVLIDPTNLIYQVAYGPIEGITAVYDGGVALGQNKILNGDFSQGWDFWYHNKASIITGSLSLASLGAGIGVAQHILLSPGCTYTFSFDVVDLDVSTGGGFLYASYGYNYTGSINIPPDLIVYMIDEEPLENFTIGNTFSYTFTIPSDASEIQTAIEMHIPQAGGGSVPGIEINNINIYPAAVDHDTRAELEAAIVPRGGYHTCLNEGLIRLGSPCKKFISADIKGSIALSRQLVTDDAPEIVGDTWEYSLSKNIVSGATYRLTCDVVSNSGGTITPTLGGTAGAAVASDGGYTWDIVATDATGLFFDVQDGEPENVKLWRIRPDKKAAVGVSPAIKQLLLTWADFLDSDFDDTAFGLLSDANSSLVSTWYGIDDNPTILDALDPLADSIGGWYGYNATGKFTCGRLVLPTGSPDATLNMDYDAFSMSRQNFYDDNEGLISYRTELQHQPIFHTQGSEELITKTDYSSGDIAGYCSETRRAFLARQFRTVISEDLTVLEKELASKSMKFTTLLEENAQTEADRRRVLYSTPLDRWICDFPLEMMYDSTTGIKTSLGGTVALVGSRLGLSTVPKYYFVLGINLSLGNLGVPKVQLDLLGEG